MMIAPLSANVLSDTVASTGVNAFSLGLDRANLFTDDIHKQSEFRGAMVVAADSKLIDFDVSATGYTATLTETTHLSIGEACTAVKEAMTTQLDNTWQVLHNLDVSDVTLTNRIQIRGASSFTLKNNTGSNAANSWCVNLAGYRSADDVTGTTLTADYPIIHAPHDQIAFDLTEAKAINAVFMAGHNLSALGWLGFDWGSTSALGDGPKWSQSDSGTMMLKLPTVANERYCAVYLRNQRLDTHRLRVGHLWAGAAYDTSSPAGNNWEKGSYGAEGVARFADHTAVRMKGGHLSIAELEAGEEFSIGWGGSPGLSPVEKVTLQHTLDQLGRGKLAYIAVDPDDEPHRQTRLCRVKSEPEFIQASATDAHGRWAVALSLKVVL